MDPQAASQLARYRLFRPLALDSPHYEPHTTDQPMVEEIVRWSSHVLLGGAYYDLRVRPEQIFQVPSNMMNRQVYIIPVWEPKLVRTIVLGAKRKTRKVLEGCGQGQLESLNFIGGILFLKRVLFRGTKRYLEGHESRSAWFVEDRYHMDIFIDSPEGQKDGAAQTDRPIHYGKQIDFRPVLRVFHDSVGCVVNQRWSAGEDLDKYNQSIKTYVPEYYPEADSVIMSWHEFAAHLNLQDTGIYALSNFIASEKERGMHYLAIGSSFFWGETVVGGASQEADISAADDQLWTQPGQPLKQELVNKYDGFFKRSDTTGSKTPIPIDTYSKTRLFESNLSVALVQFFLSKANGSAQYLGHGFFAVRAENGTTLAAGTGNWGSAESQEIGISTEA